MVTSGVQIAKSKMNLRNEIMGENKILRGEMRSGNNGGRYYMCGRTFYINKLSTGRVVRVRRHMVLSYAFYTWYLSVNTIIPIRDNRLANRLLLPSSCPWGQSLEG